MATLKANGGAIRFYQHPNGSRIAVCANGRVLVNPGGHDGWKRSRIKKEEIEERGFLHVLQWHSDRSTVKSMG